MNNIVKSTDENIIIACDILSQGGIIGIPTETVYGLAGDSCNSNSIAHIYNVKNRPEFNPLITHCDSIDMIKTIANFNEDAIKLLNRFSPGAISLVLNKKSDCSVSSLACAGLDSIAVRIPNHAVALKLISAYGLPLCVPSANKSGGISPTKAEHVYNSLADKVDMILDGGRCETGIESTIIDLTGNVPVLLRSGGIAINDIESVLGIKLQEQTFVKGNNPIAPGQLKSHYSPDIPLFMNMAEPQLNHAYIGFGKCNKCDINLSESGDVVEAASNLFDTLHILNNFKYSGISVAPVPNQGLGIAINDKLIRASVNNKK